MLTQLAPLVYDRHAGDSHFVAELVIAVSAVAVPALFSVGAYALSAGYYEAFYGQAQRVRTVIRDEFAAALERFDVLVSPTSPTVAFPLGAKTDNPLAMYLSDVLAIPPNMAGLPGLSIPCGLSEGLPVGLQLVGRQFSENLLFRAGHALEQALAFDPVPTRYAA